MNRLVTIFGSPGSGKTTLSLAIASLLALQKKDVIILNTDRTVPHLRVLLPTVETDKSKSMGELLLRSGLTQKQVSERLVFHPDSDCFACLALAPGDNPITYPPVFDRDKIVALLDVLASLADCVIVDGSANPAADSITLTALELSERIICTLTPDRKGLSYLSGTLDILRDEKYKTGKHLRVLSPVRPVSPAKEIQGLVEDIRFLLPYSPEVEERTLAGKLLRGFGRREGLIYESRVKKLWEALG